MSTEVVCLEISQIDAASKTLVHAFNNNPIFCYFVSAQEQVRINAIQLFAKTVLRCSQPYNHVYTSTNELKGIAIWIPPSKYPLNDFRLL